MTELLSYPSEDVRLSTGRDIRTYHLASTSADAPPAVYVHGLGGSATNWWLLMPELVDALDQWTFDLPGFGDSPPSSPHTVKAYADDVTAFLERFDRPVHLVGNSMGGMISVLVAASRPDLVDTLTLIAPAMPQRRLPSTAAAVGVVALPRVGEQLMARVNGVSPEEQVQRMLELTYADPSSVDSDDLAFAIDERRRRMADPHAEAVLLEALRSIVVQYLLPGRQSAWQLAGRILAPTMVMVGAHDTLVGAWSARRWQRTLPNAWVLRMPSSGHVAMMEQPALVAEQMRGFLAAVHHANNHSPRNG